MFPGLHHLLQIHIRPTIGPLRSVPLRHIVSETVPQFLTSYSSFLWSRARRTTNLVRISPRNYTDPSAVRQILPRFLPSLNHITVIMAPSNSLRPPQERPGLRRLSSMTATERELKEGGPVVVVPERMMLQRSKSLHGGFAASMETARNELNALNLEEEALASSSSSSPETPGSPITPADIPSVDSFAFAFDIDGVLIRGGRPIPEAIEAMKMLNGENEWGMKV